MAEKGELQSDLQRYYDEVDQIRREATALVERLTEAQCAWQAAPNQWSIAQCLEHLNATARNYFPIISDSINQARSQGWLGAGPFRYGWLGGYFVRLSSPPPRFRMRAPRRFIPPPDRPMSEIWPSFRTFQDRLQELIVHANGVDLARATVQSPVLKIIRFSLGNALALMVAHERRHLWQAQQIRENENFPK
jgi:hypothetical protein